MSETRNPRELWRKRETSLSRNLVSPARQLSQRRSEGEQQRGGARYRGIPEFTARDLQARGPAPTLYNANTGEWYEVTPMEARLHNIELGPGNPSERIFRAGERRTHSPTEMDYRGEMRA